MAPAAQSVRLLALAALFGGAVAIATAPIYVRLSETGPVATAFWRVTLALPFLWAWALASRPRGSAPAMDPRRERWLMLGAGVFFAGDLAVWHWSIVLTSVANATLLANLAPIFVTLAAWWLYALRPTPVFLGGLAAALAGMVLLIGGKFEFTGTALLGDALGVLTAMFYAAYQLTVARLRTSVGTARIMAQSSTVMAVILLPLAALSAEPFFPQTATGWALLLGLAVMAQVAGQSLIAYAFAHLPATFSSVGLLLQPVAAALFAFVLLGETLAPLQIGGGVLVLAGIRLAHQGSRRPVPAAPA